MKRFLITYQLAGKPDRREISIRFASGDATARSVARAIIRREFAEIDLPFGPGEVWTAEQALQRFAIEDVKWSEITDDKK